jgi:formate dehydrogenase major subunit
MTTTEHATVAFELNGRTVEALSGETILQAARRHGVSIPHLCHADGLRPDGNCRACVVEVEGEGVLAPSCCRHPQQGMKVRTDSERTVHSQKMVLELLLSDMPSREYRRDSELDHWRRTLGVGRSRFPGRAQPAPDLSHPAMAVNLDACIQCTRCLRACREEQVNDVIGYAFRGGHAQIVFDMGDPMGESSCVACGECVQACPTGALMPARDVGMQAVDRKVDTVCPYCGVGCLLTYHVQGNRILFAEGRDGPSNRGRLCVKGRFGFDYTHHTHRLTTPLIRREGAAKPHEPDLDPGNPDLHFREATWEEALAVATRGLRDIRDTQGPGALAGFGSAKGSNEEAYLFQKLVRTGFGTNNVDHCTRLCHASSVAAMLEMIGSGAVSNPVEDVARAEVFIVIGATPTDNHPVAATFMKNAVEQGKTLIVMDPRRTDMARHAKYVLQFKAATDVALLNALMNVIIEDGLTDEKFIAERTEGFEAMKTHLKDFTPEAMAPVCGIPAETIREVAHVYAKSRGSMIFWGMGISQHIHGTDNARCLISLALMTGQIGRPGTGLHPLRGQNNVQGASDVGLIPMMFPDYRRVDNTKARAFFETLWGTRLDPEPGLTVVEIMDAAHAGRIRGMYIMGENPAMSDPNLNHAREALARLDHLVVQDIFLTETAMYADVILPASAFQEKTGTFTNTDRRVQLGRQAINSPGEARPDLDIIQDMARGMGLQWNYAGVAEVFEEMRQAMPSIRGITWDRLEATGSITYPCESGDDPGQPVIFTQAFPTPSGRARFVPAGLISAAELPDREYPFLLITGRQLEHWHTGAMTRRATILDAIEPLPVVSINPLDLATLGVSAGETVTLESRRGSVEIYTRADDGLQPGTVFLPFCYQEAAANLLTHQALDPYGKIPEFKYSSVRVLAGGQVPPRKGHETTET